MARSQTLRNRKFKAKQIYIVSSAPSALPVNSKTQTVLQFSCQEVHTPTHEQCQSQCTHKHWDWPWWDEAAKFALKRSRLESSAEVGRWCCKLHSDGKVMGKMQRELERGDKARIEKNIRDIPPELTISLSAKCLWHLAVNCHPYKWIIVAWESFVSCKVSASTEIEHYRLSYPDL